MTRHPPSTALEALSQFTPESDLSLPQAQALIQAWSADMLPAIAATASPQPLTDALNGVLAHDIRSPMPVPPHDHAAMDGYALAARALQSGQATRLKVLSTIQAGDPLLRTQADDVSSCWRIMTGAALPPGTDTVVAQEDCASYVDATQGECILIPADQLPPGAHVRRQGEDLRIGQIALPAGRCLSPIDLGLAASLGLEQLPLRRRLRVAVLSTGSELRALGDPLPAGCVHDSNRYILMGLLHRLGMTPIDLGLIRDDAPALQKALHRACQSADVVLTTGGVGQGDADHTYPAASQLGTVTSWHLALKPGRPLVVGALHPSASSASHVTDQLIPFFGLPGNPVAVIVTFCVLVRDALLRWAGVQPRRLATVTALTTRAVNKRVGRTEYLRAHLTPGNDHPWQVTPMKQQSSGMLHGLSQADGLIVLPHHSGPVPAQTAVQVLPLYGLW